MYSTFVSTQELHQALVDQSKPWIIIDCRFYLSDTDLGYNEYLREHIPTAIYAHLDRDLSGPITPITGRHPLPKIDKFKDWITKNNVNKSSQIVVYDQMGGGIAARLWWMLVQLGYQEVAVLEGGIIDWKRKGLSMISGIESRDNVNLDLSDLGSTWADGPSKLYSKNDIREVIDTDIHLVDSRSPERYSGELETIDPIAGHIPSAMNVFWQSHLAEDFTLKSIDLIKNIFEKKIDLNKELAFYCGSGVTAAFNILIVKHLGVSVPGLYVGSWSEWISDKI
ncbi:MAG: sulfurtransferase [Candidatus Heimdallarchaeota archaeon]|nr:sulfurtransferase [Candidatus Heimdallarchaeota archaeon]